MQRRTADPRPDWQQKVESVGLLYHTPNPAAPPYWNESAFYEFTAAEIDTLEAATLELQARCLEAAQHIIDQRLYQKLAIPPAAIPLIERTWNEEPPALYGRFDLAYDGSGPPKLLEYNADTPTAFVEAAVVQWYWLQDRFPGADQFNSLHEKLIAKWKDLVPYVAEPLYFAHLDDAEDLTTVTYLRDTAEQAGITTSAILMPDIGWDSARRHFVDLGNHPLRSIFKLYPWEGMLYDEFGTHALDTYGDPLWIEPIWKMLFSNKGILAVLWELFPQHPNLLPAYFDGPRDLTEYARKPLLSREGANINLVSRAGTVSTPGDYGHEGFIHQALAPVFHADGRYAVLGSWLIDQDSAGMGIRESSSPITDNLASFVPHLFR